MATRRRNTGKKNTPLIDTDEAKKVMEQAVALANDPAAHGHPDFAAWSSRIDAFSEEVKKVGYKQSIALLGATLIAKTTNTQVDVLILKCRAKAPGAYNVRRPADDVLFPASLVHKFDIGSTSRNPLNGASFLSKDRLDHNFTLRGTKGKDLGKQVYDILSQVS